VMSSASSAVTYTSVYTNFEPGRVFWGADEEISDGGTPSPDYIPGPDDPQTPQVPQDEDEREPMFIQAHDPDYVPEPIYPEYVTKSDPEEDPEEYEDDEIEDGSVDYPMDEGDDGDKDGGDSSRDDANDEDKDEDKEDKEEEDEHLASADSAVVVPVDEPVFISLPPKAEVERILAMTTPSPSPPISLSPPSVGERLARCTALPAHSSPLPVPSPLLPPFGCPTQIRTLRIASTQALIDEVNVALPSTPLPPSLYIPPPVDYPAEAVPEIAPMTMGEVNTRVTELAELHEHDTQDLYALLEDAQDRDNMDGGGGGLCFPRDLASLNRIESGTSDTATATGYSHSDTASETLRMMRDMRGEMGDMQTELLALRGQRRARQPALDTMTPDHQDASGDADSHV
ncbi:hypothetical protein Tco_1440863, partial [Tanacetum coccineum]